MDVNILDVNVAHHSLHGELSIVVFCLPVSWAALLLFSRGMIFLWLCLDVVVVAMVVLPVRTGHNRLGGASLIPAFCTTWAKSLREQDVALFVELFLHSIRALPVYSNAVYLR